MNILIEKMGLKDLNEVLEIEGDSFITPWSRGTFIDELRNNKLAHLFVARQNDDENKGKVLGYVSLWIFAGEAHITNIATHKNYRQKGIGSMLLRHSLAYAKEKGCREAVLEVRKSNKTAILMYKSFGFDPIAIRRKYYADTDEDAIVMALKKL